MLKFAISGKTDVPTLRRIETSVTDELAEYDYVLPVELIARRPAERREDARLMVVDRRTGQIEHRRIVDLPGLLAPGDALVLNDTRVLPARLLGRRATTGGRWEGLFLETTAEGYWRLLIQTRGTLRFGERILVHPAHEPHAAESLGLELVSRDAEGIWTVRPPAATEPLSTLAHFGTVPLPPYMGRKLADAVDFERYQTTYARHPGSVAAPTAGMHLTPGLLERLTARGIEHCFVTLHVGIGTFRPISASRLSDHRMHAEWCDVSAETAARLEDVSRRGGRIVAVGTTSVRTLETAAASGQLAAWSGPTDLFIRAPYAFRSVNALLTNFHLPRSTLLVLVCAFAGRELVLEAYAQAVRENYRFYSYGDAMLIL